MDAFHFLLHLLGFAAPAVVVALAMALAGRWIGSKGAQRPGWWASVAINLVAGLAVLGAGLWYFGRDGKMATYAALVLVVASTQWLSARAWRR